MISLFIVLALIFGLCGVGFAITGALLKAMLWVCIGLPVGLALCAVGLLCCCTIIMIPVGMGLFKAGATMMCPL